MEICWWYFLLASVYLIQSSVCLHCLRICYSSLMVVFCNTFVVMSSGSKVLDEKSVLILFVCLHVRWLFVLHLLWSLYLFCWFPTTWSRCAGMIFFSHIWGLVSFLDLGFHWFYQIYIYFCFSPSAFFWISNYTYFKSLDIVIYIPEIS